MRWIKAISLKNFQQHTNLDIEFDSKFNVIHGKSDAGKSTVIRAIGWVLYNEPKGDSIRRNGTETAYVKLTFDNGVAIVKEKGDKVNAYEIIKDGKTQRFDAVGKNIPDAVIAEIGIRPLKVGEDEELILNIASQMEMPFLLDAPASFRMKVFNQLTGNNILDSVAQSFNRDGLSLSKEQKVLESDIEYKIINLGECKQKRISIEWVLIPIEETIKKVKLKVASIVTARKLYERYISIDSNIIILSNQISDIRVPDELVVFQIKDRVQKVSCIRELLNKCNKLSVDIQSAEKSLSSFVDVDVKPLADKIKAYDVILNYNSKLKSVELQEINLSKDLSAVDVRLSMLSSDYKNILRESGICPTCKSNITEEVLNNIKI